MDPEEPGADGADGARSGPRMWEWVLAATLILGLTLGLVTLRHHGEATAVFPVCKGNAACNSTLAGMTSYQRADVLLRIAQVQATQANADAAARQARTTRSVCLASGSWFCN